MFALPYVAAAVQLAEGRAPRESLRILIGLLCGVGMAFKPYLLAIPLLVEAFLLWETRAFRALFRPEIMGMAASLAVYPILVWQFTPQYFTEILPLALQTYGAFQNTFSETVLRPAVAGFLLFLGIAAYFMRHRNGQQRGDWVWIFAGLGGFLCYLAQQKSWTYQLLPAMIFASIPFLLNAFRLSGFAPRLLVFACFGIVMIKGLVNFVSDQNSRLAYVDDLLAGRKAQRMMALTYDLSLIFPYVETRNIVWASRFQSFWMLPAVSRELMPVERRDAIITRTAEAVAADLIKWKPDFVIVDRRSHTPRLRGREIEYIAWFSRSPAFAQVWSSYKLVNSDGMFEVWELT